MQLHDGVARSGGPHLCVHSAVVEQHTRPHRFLGSPAHNSILHGLKEQLKLPRLTPRSVYVLQGTGAARRRLALITLSHEHAPHRLLTGHEDQAFLA